MKEIAQYPSSVWDGGSDTRDADLLDQIDSAPDYKDWDQLTAEVVATQTRLDTLITSTSSLDADDLHTVANANIVGGIPVVHRIDVANASADTDVILTYKTRVIDVVVVKIAANGGSGDTVTVKNGTTAITNAMSLNINDQLIARATSINDASHEIAAGGTLRCTGVSSTNCACIVYVHGIRVA